MCVILILGSLWVGSDRLNTAWDAIYNLDSAQGLYVLLKW